MSPALVSGERPEVTCVGAHILDVLARPVESIPEGQGTVLVDRIRLAPAGSAAGTAVALARLGNRVRTAGAVGADESGDLLLTMLARRGVDATGVRRRAQEQTATSILPIRPDGGRPSFHAPGANLTVTLADLDPAWLTGAAGVHLGGVDVTFGLTDPAFFALLDQARAGGTVITMDLLSAMPDLLTATLAYLPHVDYVLPDEEQALAMTGAADAETAAARLLGHGARGVVVTLGGAGSLVVTAEETLRLPACPVDVVDTSGCGDAYCAGFLTALLHGHPVRTAARWGTAAAALVATGLGSDAGLTGLDAVLALLGEEPLLSGRDPAPRDTEPLDTASPKERTA